MKTKKCLSFFMNALIIWLGIVSGGNSIPSNPIEVSVPLDRPATPPAVKLWIVESAEFSSWDYVFKNKVNTSSVTSFNSFEKVL